MNLSIQSGSSEWQIDGLESDARDVLQTAVNGGDRKPKLSWK